MPDSGASLWGRGRPGRLSVGSRVGLWPRSGCEEPDGLGGRDGLDTWPAPVARRLLAHSQLVPFSREGSKLIGRMSRRVPDQSCRRRVGRDSWEASWSIGGCACQRCLGSGRISDLPVGYNFLLGSELLGTGFRCKPAAPW